MTHKNRSPKNKRSIEKKEEKLSKETRKKRGDEEDARQEASFVYSLVKTIVAIQSA